MNIPETYDYLVRARRNLWAGLQAVPVSRAELHIRKGLRQQLLQLLKNRAHFVAPSGSLQITPDPADNIFLECADAARADYLITGNELHFPKFWKKTKIISSREFIGIVGPHLLS